MSYIRYYNYPKLVKHFHVIKKNTKNIYTEAAEPLHEYNFSSSSGTNLIFFVIVWKDLPLFNLL